VSIGSHIENVVRAMHRPILVVMPGFTHPKRVMIAIVPQGTLATDPCKNGFCQYTVMFDKKKLRDG
jgi:hypothetical protein